MSAAEQRTRIEEVTEVAQVAQVAQVTRLLRCAVDINNSSRRQLRDSRSDRLRHWNWLEDTAREVKFTPSGATSYRRQTKTKTGEIEITKLMQVSK